MIMSAQEFATIASAIKAAYPAANIMPDKQSKEVWYTMLADLDYHVCLNALKEHISICKFAPSISELRERCASMTSEPVLQWGDAWERVLGAVRFYGMYREKEALGSLDEATQNCVKRIGFKNICLSENIQNDRANFRMIYEQEAAQRKEMSQLPDSVRENRKRLQSLAKGTIHELEQITKISGDDNNALDGSNSR